ncbi:hypothetical protein HMPREF9057_01383 [Actinomyces sp. oral taxon 171 str. F0337]|nr:hypothetical protein HMPREF9057_01383 [Actinomyces sp. oral taxon 171 str. F0337]
MLVLRRRHPGTSASPPPTSPDVSGVLSAFSPLLSAGVPKESHIHSGYGSP